MSSNAQEVKFTRLLQACQTASAATAPALWRTRSILYLLMMGAAFLAVGQNKHLVNDCMHLCRMHRRKTMVVQQSVELVLQLFNVTLYLTPNVHALVQKCVWGDNLVGTQHGPLEPGLYMFALAKQCSARRYSPCHCRSAPAPQFAGACGSL